MNHNISILNIDKIKDISNLLLKEDGKIKLLSYLEYNNFNWEEFRFFCHNYARYGIPTLELISFIKEIIGNRTVIEIGAGSGDLGYHLGIHMTDSKMQEDPLIKMKYEAVSQPIIKYPQDVEKIESLDAVIKYKPKVVVASWVTVFSPFQTTYGSSPHGIKEEDILELVDTYFLIGNLDSHGDKPIMKIPHRTIDEPFIMSRSMNRKGNRIWIWDNERKVDTGSL